MLKYVWVDSCLNTLEQGLLKTSVAIYKRQCTTKDAPMSC